MSTRNLAVCLLAAACLAASVRIAAAAECTRGTQVTAGEDDNFALPTEPTQPSDRLLSYTQQYWPVPATRRFDVTGTDVALIHTFSGWKGPVCGATLTLHLHAGPSLLSNNDSVRMELQGGSDIQQAFLYWVTIRYVLGDWGPGQDGVVTLDLGDLPVYGGFPTNILNSLNDGRMDLMVEDDTAVDYARLDICGCHHTNLDAPDRVTWGHLKAMYRNEEQ